jgi:hypothetical protein
MKYMKKWISAAFFCAAGVVCVGVTLLPGGSQPRQAVAGGADSAVTVPAPTPTVDESAYDAKMTALANIQPRTGCAEVVAVSSPKATLASGSGTAAVVATTAAVVPQAVNRKRTALRPCPKPLWPVHAAYPDAGALLPFKRVVAYYGNYYSPRMGILGEYPPDKVVALLKDQAAAYAKADPTTPVILAVDYIVAAAQSAPGRDGKYVMRMPLDQIEKAVNMAQQVGGLLFLDVQPGWSTVEAEVPRLAPYLKQPNVHLALDPEFALTGGRRPGAWRGTMNASDINFAARFLAKIAQENHLPPKILVVHRFTERMVTDYRAIKPLPEVEIVMDMDGFGAPSLKHAAYRDFIENQPVQFTGFKLFYKNDVKWGGRVMTPAEVLRLSPQPIYILYQ